MMQVATLGRIPDLPIMKFVPPYTVPIAKKKIKQAKKNDVVQDFDNVLTFHDTRIIICDERFTTIC